MLSSIKLLKFALVCLLIHSAFTESVSALPLGLWSGPDRREIFFRVHGRYVQGDKCGQMSPGIEFVTSRKARMSLARFVITAEQQWLEALAGSMKGNQVKYSLALFAVSLHTGRSWWCCEINGKFHLFNIISSDGNCMF